LKKHAPIKKKRVKRLHQPDWYTDDIKHARRIRDKFKACNNELQYKIWRNKCTSLIRKSKKNFYNSAVENKKEPNLLWKNLKCISDDSSNINNLPSTLQVGERSLNNPDEIVNALNQHFVNISNKINRVDFKAENFIDLKNQLNEKLGSLEFDINFITPFEVSKIIHHLHANKSTGLDGISPKIIKICKDVISPILANIINLCISQGIFPDIFKFARVIPIHKGSDKDDPSNYRPISILPTLSKIFERHIATQLQNYFHVTNILHPNQSGFRKNHSCQTALIRIVDTWVNAIDCNELVGTVFIDLKKAFDLVDHQILLHKLKLYHFSNNAINLFASYLSNRMQLVKHGEWRSDFLPVTTGVPQGSILGPLLFILYINDISLNISSPIDMYADDATLHVNDRNIQVIEQKLQNDLNVIDTWCHKNNMAVNPSKTTCMVITSKRQANRETDLKLFINHVQIKNVKCQKLLGIYIDNTLSWKEHINKTCSKVVSKISLLKRISYFLTSEMKQLFYNAYIVPILDYGCVIWSHANTSALNRIIKLQKRTARIILHKPIQTQTKELFTTLKWLSFFSRCKYHSGLIVYKALNKLAPDYITNILPVANNESYNLRSSSRKDIQHIRPRTNVLRNSFRFTGMNIWNSTPLHIRSSNNIVLFKKKLKSYLLQNDLS
jgi:hypothetical protein